MEPAAAADLSLTGHQVTLYDMPAYQTRIESIARHGGLVLSSEGQTRVARIDHLTTDIAEAVRGAPMILVATVGWAHRTLAELAAPYLENGQTAGAVFCPVGLARILQRDL